MVFKDTVVKNSKNILYHSYSNYNSNVVDERLIFSLVENGYNISWYPTYFNSNIETIVSEDIHKLIKHTINKDIEYDTVLFHCSISEMLYLTDKEPSNYNDKILVYYYTEEPISIKPEDVFIINKLHEIWVPTNWSKNFLEKNGVNIPIKVIPCAFINRKLPGINDETLTCLLNKSIFFENNVKKFNYSSKHVIFYIISNNLNNIKLLIKCFCKSFTSNDLVKLIIYTGTDKKNNIVEESNKTITRYKSPPEILLINERISYDCLDILHSIGTCYINLDTGDQFPVFANDSMFYNKDIITVNYGGLSYLSKKYLIDFRSNLIDTGKLIKVLKSYLKNVKYKNLYSDVIFKSGWYFVEEKNGIFQIKSNKKSTIIFNNKNIDYIKFKIKYKFGEDIKSLSMIMGGTLRRSIELNKNTEKEIIVPFTNRIDFETSTFVPKKYDLTLVDNRNVGIELNWISVIKDNLETKIEINSIKNEDELTDFCYISNGKMLELKMLKDGFINQSDDMEVKFKIGSNSEYAGILYIGQYGTSGYATAAKGNLYYFLKKGIPVSWIPLFFDNSKLSDDCVYNIAVKSLINKKIDYYDTVIIHCTPDLWPEMVEKNKNLLKGKKIIGYTVWESSQLPLHWVDNINECVSEVWCPSIYNESVFKNSGVNVPIKVFPHVFLEEKLLPKESVTLKWYNNSLCGTNNIYTFYNIGELNPRKGIDDLVKVFCNSFTKSDLVRLILKIHYKNYDEKNKRYCIESLSKIVCSYENPPDIYYILDNVTENELLALHSIGDCYVSLHKSEGFGLTIYDAFKYGKKIIATGYSGPLDFLGEDYKGLVKYKLGKVTGMESWNIKYDGEWAYPDLKHAGELMKQIV